MRDAKWNERFFGSRGRDILWEVPSDGLSGAIDGPTIEIRSDASHHPHHVSPQFWKGSYGQERRKKENENENEK